MNLTQATHAQPSDRVNYRTVQGGTVRGRVLESTTVDHKVRVTSTTDPGYPKGREFWVLRASSWLTFELPKGITHHTTTILTGDNIAARGRRVGPIETINGVEHATVWVTEGRRFSSGDPFHAWPRPRKMFGPIAR